MCVCLCVCLCLKITESCHEICDLRRKDSGETRTKTERGTYIFGNIEAFWIFWSFGQRVADWMQRNYEKCYESYRDRDKALEFEDMKVKVIVSQSDSLRPRGLYSPQNPPGQNTGVGSLSLLQGIFLTQGSNPGLPLTGGFFTSWATREALELRGQDFWQCASEVAQCLKSACFAKDTGLIPR